MTKKNDIYVCRICGNVIKVIEAGAGTLVCCGQPMEKRLERNEEIV
jgi:superoxide reductase